MQVSLVTNNNTVEQMIDLSDQVFAYKFNEGLIHRVVVACLSSARQGTRAQKNRAAVSGGGKKPWRQKGSGRARAGTIRSPIWRKGGVTFAATPRDYTKKVNKKTYRLAMRSIFSELIRQERLSIVDALVLDRPKTKDLLAQLRSLDLMDVLLVLDKLDPVISLSARNIPTVDVCDAYSITPVKLLSFHKVLVTTAALRQIEEWLQ